VVNIGRYVIRQSRAFFVICKERKLIHNKCRVKSGKWEYVKWEIERLNDAIVDAGAIAKVIFENDCTYFPASSSPVEKLIGLDLTEEEIIRLCEICTEVGVAYIKTSTGYGFTKLSSGDYNYKGATIRHLELMRKHAGPEVKIKAAGGVRTLDDLLRVRALGVSRVGATATEAILEEAVKRGIGEERREVEVKWDGI